MDIEHDICLWVGRYLVWGVGAASVILFGNDILDAPRP